MIIGFHFQGQFCTADMQNGQVESIFIDEKLAEINLLPEMLPEIMKAYRITQAKLNEGEDCGQ